MKTNTHQAGFSLLEILVAFAVLALTLGVLLRIFGGGTRTAQTIDEYTRALSIAESLLAAAGVETPLEEGETEGDLNQGYHWRLRVTPYPVSPELLVTDAAVPPPIRPYWLELTVEWGDEDEPRHIALQTLRTLKSGSANRPTRVPFR